MECRRFWLQIKGHSWMGSISVSSCTSLNIDKRRSTPYHPQCNGMVERNVGFVNQVMLCLMLDRQLGKGSWPSLLQEVSFHCNCMSNASNQSSTGGWMVRALVFQGDGRVFESNQWLSFDFQILSYLLRFKIRVSTLCASFRTSHSWAYSPVTAVWSPSGQLAGCGLDYGCGRRRTMSIPVRLRAAILGAKRSYSCSSDCLVLRLCQLLSSIYD